MIYIHGGFSTSAGWSLHHHHSVDHRIILKIVRLIFQTLEKSVFKSVVALYQSSELQRNFKKWQVQHLKLKARPIINWVSDSKTAHKNPELVAVSGFICSHLSGLGTQGLSRNGSWPKSETPCPNPAPQRKNFMTQGLRRVASCKWHCKSYICIYIYMHMTYNYTYEEINK